MYSDTNESIEIGGISTNSMDAFRSSCNSGIYKIAVLLEVMEVMVAVPAEPHRLSDGTTTYFIFVLG